MVHLYTQVAHLHALRALLDVTKILLHILVKTAANSAHFCYSFPMNHSQNRTTPWRFPSLRLPLLFLLAAQTARADMVSTFLNTVVGLITGTWAIAIVVIATFYVGYLFFFSDRRTHEHLSGWLFGCIFVLGCQVLAQQFIH